MKYRIAIAKVATFDLTVEQWNHLILAMQCHEAAGFRDGETRMAGVKITELAKNTFEQNQAWLKTVRGK